MQSVRQLKDFSGKDSIFVDSNVFLHHAFDSNESSVEFLKNIEKRGIKAYTSVIVLEEVFFKLIFQQVSNFLKKVTIDSVKTFLEDTENREKVFEPINRYRDYLDTLKKFGLKVIEVTDKDMKTALKKAREYGLITADALHVAIMQRKAIIHIASADKDFEQIDGIFIWKP